MSKRKIKEINIKKSPVKVTSISFEINVLGHIGTVSEDMGYTKSALVNKVMKEWIEARMLAEAQEAELNK